MIYLILYLLVETLISVEISSRIGGLATFLEIIATAIVGVYILRDLPNSLLFNTTEFMGGGISLNQFKSRNIFPLVGAILLIMPGFFTDILGILMQFSIVSDLFTSNSDDVKFNRDILENNIEDNIIDVEVIDSDKNRKD